MLFRNRRHAGIALGEALSGRRNNENLLVLGLPRGGVEVAAEVAAALNAPLDILLVRKLGVPGHEELAAGAIAEGGVRVLNESVLTAMNLSDRDLEPIVSREARVLHERARRYRHDGGPPDVQGKTVIVIDDGLATGATMRAALSTLYERSPERVIVAVPVAPDEVVAALKEEADEVVCLYSPQDFGGVGKWYGEFPQLDDQTVVDLLGSKIQSR